MKDTIYRHAAIDAVRSYYDEQYALVDSIEELIEKLPSAQSEIIRCKDCKHYFNEIHCDRVAWWNGEDDFCSRAERRTDDLG